MHADILTRMANQIGQFFEAMPDREESLEGAASHIKSFWEPRMRRELLAAISAPGGLPELSAFMTEALARHRALVEEAASPA
jgi:formate dehydrogenase subunit delta